MSVQVLPDDAHNQALLEQVRPPGWANPEPAGRYNLVVLGAGTAGLVAAAGAAGLGAKVALVERGLMGGDCLNYGCVPSKALLRAARAAAAVRRAGEFGVRVPEGVAVDFAAVMARMRRLRAAIAPHDSAERFRRLGIDVFLGEARFTGPDAVEVDGRALRFRRCVIATGGRPAEPPIPGLEEAGSLTNETVFALTELPRRLAVLGDGPVGCELAQAFARFGSEVFLVSKHSHVMTKEDPAAARLVEEAMRRDGVQILHRTQLTRVEVREGEKRLFLDGEAGQTERAADAILVGVGRRPNVEGLNLEAAGVAYDPRQGVRVDDYLRTTNRAVYAAGDVCTRYKFTHAADAMARIVLRNSLLPLGRARMSALLIPRCTYTDPEVAAVGLTEEEAERQGVAYDVFEQPLAEVDRAVLDGEADGFVKILVKKGSDKILGATIVAAHAGEVLPEVTVAMQAGFGLRKLAGVIHAYPTQAEAVKKLADAYNRTRLTPFVRRLLEKRFAWGR
ncbi:MAG TPA: mercuric reductase [Gemmataceae bacterium]